MSQLTPRERVRRAISRQEPDRVPLDLGTTTSTTMVEGAHERLKQYMGISGQTRLISVMFQLVWVEEAILRELKIDLRPVMGKGPSRPRGGFGPQGTFVDEWGVTFRRPPGGLYYDIVSSPLREATWKDLESYPFPDPLDPGRVAGVEEEARMLHENTDYAVVGSAGGPTNIFELSWYLRGLDQFLIDLVSDKPFAHALLRKITDLQKARYGEFLRKTGKYLDIIRAGDDLGTQGQPLLSPALYREMIKPYHREFFSFLKEHTDAALMFHSCGNVYPLIPDLIEAGVDILNPIQVSAKDMEPARLKREFGDRLAFSGAIDTQHVMPHGTPEEVEEEVRQRIKELGPGGGYLIASVHNIQPDVPPENVVAMFRAGLRYGRYPLRLP
ncbi:MAG: uroporphyrinogen decarboxylase family protein [candidate division NC10 bacterium]|nr:uroporphyrinogen decarboxylase family protein [candidate division NC10 bacterium]